MVPRHHILESSCHRVINNMHFHSYLVSRIYIIVAHPFLLTNSPGTVQVIEDRIKAFYALFEFIKSDPAYRSSQSVLGFLSSTAVPDYEEVVKLLNDRSAKVGVRSVFMLDH